MHRVALDNDFNLLVANDRPTDPNFNGTPAYLLLN